MLQSEKDYHGCWVPGSVSTVHFWNPKCRKNMQTYRYIGHLLVMIWNIHKELLKHCIFVQNISLLQSFSFFNFTYIIHKAKEYNNGTNKISWSFSLDFICPAICACVWYVYVCMYACGCMCGCALHMCECVLFLQNSESHEASRNTLAHFGTGIRAWEHLDAIQIGCAMSPPPATACWLGMCFCSVFVEQGWWRNICQEEQSTWIWTYGRHWFLADVWTGSVRPTPEQTWG